MIIDCALYEDGRRQPGTLALEDVPAACHLENAFVWIGLYEPTEEEFEISAWVAIAAVPTMVAGIYGMNFEHMPELGHPVGYPFILAVMVVACGLMYRFFRKSGWL